MTKERVLDALKTYIKLLEDNGITVAARVTGPETGRMSQRFTHLLWMCSETAVLVNENRMEKAMRWLGFIQGALWASNYSTLEDLKRDNMPADAVYDAERV